MWVSEEVERKFDSKRDQMIQRIINSKINYVSVGLFGSYARGEFTSRSDIDFCIVTECTLTRLQKGTLREDAEDLGVDIIFIDKKDFECSETRFMQNLRKDYKEVLKRAK